MRKLFVLLGLFLLVGCTNTIQQKNCIVDIKNNIEGYTLTGEYKIYYNKYEYVTKIEKNEKYESNKEEVIEYFYRVKNIDYENLSKYGGYEYSIEKSDNEVNIKAVLELKNTDIKEMIKNKEIDRDYTSANKLTLYGIKDYYESKGAVCNIE